MPSSCFGHWSVCKVTLMKTPHGKRTEQSLNLEAMQGLLYLYRSITEKAYCSLKTNVSVAGRIFKREEAPLSVGNVSIAGRIFKREEAPLSVGNMSIAGRIFKREEAPLSVGNMSIAGRIFKREEAPLSVGNMSIAGRIFKREEAPLSVGNMSIAGRIFKREEAPLSVGNMSIAGRIFKREEAPLSVGNVSIAGRIFKREEAPLSVGNMSIAGRIFKREEAPLSVGNMSIAGRIFKREEAPLSVGNMSIAGRIFKREEAPLSVGNMSIAGRIFKREEAPLSVGNVSIAGRIFKREEAPLSAGNFLLDLCFLLSGNTNILEAEQEKHSNTVVTSNGHLSTCLSPGLCGPDSRKFQGTSLHSTGTCGSLVPSVTLAVTADLHCPQRSDSMVTGPVSTSHKQVTTWVLVVSFMDPLSLSASPVGRHPLLIAVPFSQASSVCPGCSGDGTEPAAWSSHSPGAADCGQVNRHVAAGESPELSQAGEGGGARTDDICTDEPEPGPQFIPSLRASRCLSAVPAVTAVRPATTGRRVSTVYRELNSIPGMGNHVTAEFQLHLYSLAPHSAPGYTQYPTWKLARVLSVQDGNYDSKALTVDNDCEFKFSQPAETWQVCGRREAEQAEPFRQQFFQQERIAVLGCRERILETFPLSLGEKGTDERTSEVQGTSPSRRMRVGACALTETCLSVWLTTSPTWDLTTAKPKSTGACC
ncbi:hypothetical protein M91_06186 [Bos mutus]|uniref:Uncharacterized protein n=1 Tax=Bos mutus TaxID=72004 RepID=L8HYD2_9CETA|nr:hypothetical protein M91_06186 [Bos mutus]